MICAWARGTAEPSRATLNRQVRKYGARPALTLRNRRSAVRLPAGAEMVPDRARNCRGRLPRPRGFGLVSELPGIWPLLYPDTSIAGVTATARSPIRATSAAVPPRLACTLCVYTTNGRAEVRTVRIMEHVRQFRGLTVPAFLELWARDAGVSVEDLVSCVKVRMVPIAPAGVQNSPETPRPLRPDGARHEGVPVRRSSDTRLNATRPAGGR
jgi:hypothetical protein